MQYATLYVMDPSVVGSKVLNTIPQILSYTSKSEGEKATGMVIKLVDAEIDMNFMESAELEEHLEGLNGFASTYVKEGVDLPYVLSRIYYVQLVIGCVVKPGFDGEGRVLEFFKELNKAYKSLLFYDNKVFDYDMQVLVQLKV